MLSSRSQAVKRILVILSLLLGLSVQGQMYYDIGATLGSAYYVGDLQKRHFYLDDMRLSGGLSFRINFDPRWAWRQSVRIGSLRADDANATSDFQRIRNLNFYTPLYEFTTTVEFNFLNFDPWKDQDVFTPYIYGGLGGFFINPQTELDGNTYVLKDHKTEGTDYSNYQFSLPFGAGFKLKLSPRVFMELDWGLRRTFTDYIDDVSGYYPTNPDQLDPVTIDLSDRSIEQQGSDGTNWGTQRGNPVNKDWFVFTGISLIINLNVDPNRCYFDQDN